MRVNQKSFRSPRDEHRRLAEQARTLHAQERQFREARKALQATIRDVVRRGDAALIVAVVAAIRRLLAS
jgi:hypothetical protein